MIEPLQWSNQIRKAFQHIPFLSADDLARYGAHVRQAEPRERAAGYTEDMAALRAVQDAMCGLYFSAAAAAVNG